MARFKLKDIGTIITGNTPKTSDNRNYDSNDIYFVKPSDIDDNELSDLCSSECYISEYARGKARIVPAQSVLVTCIGIIGKVGINSVDCAFNQQINAIIPNIEKCDCRYLAYAIQRERPKLQSIANAPVVPILNKSQFSDIEISLPPLAEQRKIAAVLDKVSSLIAKRRQQLDKLDDLVKSRFMEMFGDPVQNPFGWADKPLLEMGYCKNGLNFHSDDSGVELHCLGVGDFKDQYVLDGTEKLSTVSLSVIPPKESLLEDGDIVFVRSNGNKALVGRCLLVFPHNTPTAYSGFCIRYRLTSNEINPFFLLYVLKADSIRETIRGRGASIQNLNQKILSTVRIPLPPIELQNEYATLVNQIDKSKLAIQKSLDKLEILKKALMQKYFG